MTSSVVQRHAVVISPATSTLPEAGSPLFACSTARFCLAVDDDLNAFTYMGRAWSKPGLPSTRVEVV